MSAVALSPVAMKSIAPQSSINQAHSSLWVANPSGALNRRGRLARTLAVASIAVVMAAGFSARSGAQVQVIKSASYTSVIVPAGATLWSVASAYSTGDVQGMVEAIREANNLKGYDVVAGEKLRVPSK